MNKNAPIRWFRFFTLPFLLAGVGFTIAASSVASTKLMYVAVIISGIAVISLLVGRHVINPPYERRSTEAKADHDSEQEQPQHGRVAHSHQ